MTITLNGTTGITAPGTETFGDGTALGGATNPIVSMAKGANNYVQSYIVNNTNGTSASADFVAYPNNGTDTSGWIDMGITSATFSDATYGITGANEGYIFMSAPSGASKTGNLVLATDSTGTQNAIKFATGGFGSTTERMRLDASGNLGIGLTGPGQKLHVDNTANSTTWTKISNGNSGSGAAAGVLIGTDQGDAGALSQNSSNAGYGTAANALRLRNLLNAPLTFETNGSERARIDSSGNLLVGTTSQLGAGFVNISYPGSTKWGIALQPTGTDSASAVVFRNSSAGIVGSISVTGSATAYNTSSDYRLKENIQPMTGALTTVAQLKPCTYTWNADGSAGQGFIAHELQNVIPEAVTGEKDAVETYTDEEGNEQTRPKYQGIDTSFLVATLTAAIQEQQAIITQLQADVAALKGNA